MAGDRDRQTSKRSAAATLGLAAGGAAVAGGVAATLPFWIDQFKQLQRAKANATIAGATPELTAALETQIAAAAQKIDDLGGDLSALAPESVGANFVEPTNVTAEQNKSLVPEPKVSTPPEPSVKANLSPGEITKNSDANFGEPNLGTRQHPRTLGQRSYAVGDVGELAGTMDLEKEAGAMARGAGLRTGAKLLGAIAAPVGVMAELEGTSLNAGENEMIAITQHLMTLPEFKSANEKERRIMLDAAWTDYQAQMKARQEAAQAPRTGADQRGGLRGPNAAAPYVAGAEEQRQGNPIPPDQTQLAQQLGPRDVPPQQPQQSSPQPMPQGQSEPQGLMAPSQGDHYQTQASGDGKLYEDEWPQTPGARPALQGSSAAAPQPQQAQASQRGLAAPPQQQQGGGSYANTKSSIDTTKEEWSQMLALMKSKNIKGFNWGGHAFIADDQMPSGYRTIFNRGVSRTEPEGTGNPPSRK